MLIRVSKRILDGLTAVRDSGNINMLDRPKVIQVLEQLGFDEAAHWVEQNKRTYTLGILRGFQANQ